MERSPDRSSLGDGRRTAPRQPRGPFRRLRAGLARAQTGLGRRRAAGFEKRWVATRELLLCQADCWNGPVEDTGGAVVSPRASYTRARRFQPIEPSGKRCDSQSVVRQTVSVPKSPFPIMAEFIAASLHGEEITHPRRARSNSLHIYVSLPCQSGTERYPFDVTSTGVYPNRRVILQARE